MMIDDDTHVTHRSMFMNLS